MIKRIKEFFGIQQSTTAEGRPFKLTFRSLGVKSTRACWAAQMTFHDTHEEQQRNKGFRATTSILIKRDGRVFVGVSVCSDKDNFTYIDGKRTAGRRAAKALFNDLSVLKFDLEKLGTWSPGVGSSLQYELRGEEVAPFLFAIRNVVSEARNRAMLQVHINRAALNNRASAIGGAWNVKPLSKVMLGQPLTQELKALESSTLN